MSELTPCNYCSLKRIKAEARVKKMRVVKRPSAFMGGIEIFVVPQNMKAAEIDSWTGPCDDFPNGDLSWQKHHRAWFMELSKQCCC